MLKLIDGKSIAEKIKDELFQKIITLKGVRPNLAIIVVGEREDSKLYVSLKEREGRKVGIDTHIYRLSNTSSEQELLEVINFLNNDSLIDGILLQLPLPPQFNTNKIIASISPLKDVDGFHPQHPDYIVSPVIAAVQSCLTEAKISDNEKTVSIFYNSEVFLANLQKLLISQNYIILPTKDSNQAKVIISALGEPKKITESMIKEGAVLIDIGITKIDDKVYGDVDFDSVKDKASYLTPVPGGIGPMTIAFLFKNVWEVFIRKQVN
jgi:methylenetetrahydrofolate dehydrogenase (NADP+)/methenyltetrahydrofolate cyclohydrolase